MRGFLVAAFAAFALATSAPANAVEPPYAKLAKALGTPVLADSIGPADKSRLLLKFVPNGQTARNWKKMTTVSILRVAPADTDSATRGVITRLQAQLQARHARIRTFDRSPIPPVTAYFEFSADGETSSGIVYSPDPGFVTVAQIDTKAGNAIASRDVRTLKSIVAPH
jgi:hypothetical protein